MTLDLRSGDKHNDALHSLLSTLEWEWGCIVGANVYLLHYRLRRLKDLRRITMTLKPSFSSWRGIYKHWKVYAPLSKMETLPMESWSDYRRQMRT
jgi:hypothetical protein